MSENGLIWKKKRKKFPFSHAQPPIHTCYKILTKKYTTTTTKIDLISISHEQVLLWTSSGRIYSFFLTVLFADRSFSRVWLDKGKWFQTRIGQI